MPLCPDEQTFVLLVEGSLSAEDRRSLHEHMDGCAACSELVLELARHLLPDEVEVVSATPLPERYQLMEVIGAGAMGVVHRAWDPMLERPVALKLLRSRGESDQALMKRQLREARSLASMSHPYILPIYDVGTWRGQVFMVTQFVEGGSLSRWLGAHEGASWRELLALFVQAAKGLAAAHAQGIIHRDVKPDNMLVDHKGHLWVADFGLARSQRAEDELVHPQGSTEALARSREGAILGTPLYMAPEQHLGCAVDASVDQFGLCASLFEALYGVLPFTGRSYAQLAHAVCTGQLVPVPHEREAKIPRALAQSVRRGLSLSSSDRYPSMEALAAHWEQLLRDDPELERAIVKTKTNLTPLEQPLLGREPLLTRVIEALEVSKGSAAAPLVSLVGVAGVGKTRLARAVAEAHLGSIEVVVFVDLRYAHSEDQILAAMAQALKLQFHQRDARAQLADALSAIEAGLCVLDNAEHLVAALGQLLPSWREANAKLRWLVTSRRRLGSPQEQVFKVETLEPERALELLKERAGRAWAQQDERLLVRLVTVLDGLPLAIELAASRARVLSAQQVLDGLDQRFVLLRDRQRGHDMHRALEAALAHSWELLEPLQRQVLLCATSFSAPFELEDLSALCVEQEHVEALELVDALDALVEWSLLGVSALDAGPLRFSALMSVQEFARLMAEQGAYQGVGERLSARHAARFAQLGQASRLDLAYTRAQLPVLKRLMSASVDLDRALTWACAHHALEHVVSLAAAIADACGLNGMLELGLGALERALALPELSLRDRAWLTERKGRFLRQLNLVQESTRCVEQALAWAKELGEPGLEGICIGHLGALATTRQEPKQAEEYLRQALERSSRAQDARHAAIWRGQLGIVLRQSGRIQEAVACFDEALAQARALEDWRYELVWSVNLGTVAFGQGRLDEAAARFDGALADECIKLDAPVQANLWLYRATLLKQRGRFDEALIGYEQALSRARELGLLNLEGHVTGNLGGLYFQLGRYHESRACFERALLIGQRIHLHSPAINALINLGSIEVMQHRLTQAQERFEQARDLAREYGQRTYELEAMAQLGMLAFDLGQPERALAALDEVLELGQHDGRVIGLWQVGRGYVLGHLGRFEQAREQMEQGLALLRASNMKPLLAKALCWRGEVEGLAGDITQVRRYLQEAQALATELGAPSESPISQHLNVLRQSLLALLER